jgi:hypothetical protein
MALHRLVVLLVMVGGLLLLLAPGALAAGGAIPQDLIWDENATYSWGWPVYGPLSPPGTAFDESVDVAWAGSRLWVLSHRTVPTGDLDICLSRITPFATDVPTAVKTVDWHNAGADQASDMAVAKDGSVYTVGSAASATGGSDMVIIKWSSAGTVKWSKRLKGVAAGTDHATAVAVDKAGNPVVCGYVQTTAGVFDWAVRSYTPAGKVRWTYRYDGTLHNLDIPWDVYGAPDGSVYVTGYVFLEGPKVAAHTVRMSAAGAKKWAKTYTGPETQGASSFALAKAPSSGVYVCGAATQAGTNGNGMVMRYSTSGARKLFVTDTDGGGNTNQGFDDIAVTSTGKVVAVGYSYASGNMDARATAYNADGSLMGGLTYPGGAGHDSFDDVVADGFGGYVATGRWYAAGDDERAFILRGSTLTTGGGWQSFFGYGSNTDTWFNAVAVKGTQTVAVGRYWIPAYGTSGMVLGFVY